MTIPQRFSRGGTLSAERLNAIIDCLEDLDERVGNSSANVFAGAGLVETSGAGGKVISLANLAIGGRRGVGSGASSAHPFQVSLVHENGKIGLTVKGGSWHGSGSLPANGITPLGGGISGAGGVSPDTFVIPDCELAGQDIAVGETFAVLLYAEARCGALCAEPWLYFYKLKGGAEELAKKLRDYNYTTATIVGAWTVVQEKPDAAPELRDAPGQLLKSDFWYRNTQVFSEGKFGWARCEGAKNGFYVSDGFVLVRPNSYSWRVVVGDALTLKTSTIASEQTISIPQKKYSFAAEYPESEIVFLKSIACSADENSPTTTITATAEIPKFTPQATMSRAGITYVSSASLSRTTITLFEEKKVITSVDAPWKTTIVANPDSQSSPDVYPNVLYGGLSTQSELLTASFSVPSTFNVNLSSAAFDYVSDVDFTQDGTQTAEIPIEMKTGMTIEAQSEILKPMTGGEIREEEAEAEEATVEISQKATLMEKAEDIAEELFPEVDFTSTELPTFNDRKKYFPKLHACNGAYFSLSDAEIESGVIVFLYCKASEGNALTHEWKTAPLGSSPDLGEIPQALKLTILPKILDSGNDSCENLLTQKTFAVKAALDETNFDNYASAFPMAIICQSSATGDPIVQPLVSGVLVFTPTLNISLNTSSRENQPMDADDLPDPAESELLDATKLSESVEKTENAQEQAKAASVRQAQAAIAAMRSGTPPIFDLESKEIEDALSACAPEAE